MPFYIRTRYSDHSTRRWRVSRVEPVQWLTGERSPNQTIERFGLAGTDLGILWDNNRGEVLAAFGDSYNPRNPEALGGGGGGQSGDWRFNLIGISDDRDLSDGMGFSDFVSDRPGHAREVIPRGIGHPEFEHTVIPTGGCAAGGRQYMTYMSIHDWGSAGTWHTNYAGMVYSDDGGRTWLPGPVWHNTPAWDQRFQMCTLVHHDGYVYLFGSPNGRRGRMYLARVPDAHVLDLSRHEQWNGAEWVQDQWATVPIIDEEVSESSVAFHQPSGQWLLTYLADRQGRIVMHRAPELAGPWSEPETLVTAGEYPALYGAFWHPWSMSTDTPCFVMSQWVEYNTRLMRVHFE